MNNKIIITVLFFSICTVAHATLTVNNVPRTKTGGSAPALQNSDITDVNSNVGIGSTSPGAKLDVNGSTRTNTLTVKSINSGTQCLHSDSSGNITGTGSDCGSGGGGSVANPTATIGLTAVNGSATSAIRSDGAPPLSQAIAPTWTATHIFNGVPAILTGGNVGINTALPSTSLEVLGDSTMRGNVGIYGSGPNNITSITGTGIGFDSDGNNTTDIWFDPSTNVGIGSLTPAAKLDVGGSVRMTAFMLTTNPSSGYVLTSNSVGVGTWMPSGGGSGTVSSGTTNREAVYTGSTTVGSGIITDNGTNIGIGSATPGSNLDVFFGSSTTGFRTIGSTASHFKGIFTGTPASTSGAGIIAQLSTIPSASGQRFGFYLFGANDAGADRNSAGVQGWSDQTWTTGSAAGSYLTLETTPNNSITRTERVRITNAGNVGIGTSAPTSLLNIGGNIYLDRVSSQIIMKDSGGGGGCSKITVNTGTITGATVTCP